MKVLLDHNLPKALRRLLSGHDVRTTRRQGWEGLPNGLVLLDHNLPQPLWRHLPGHDVPAAGHHGWDRLRNGVLLRAAAEHGFDLLLTVDKAMENERNLTTLPIAMGAPSTRLPDLLVFVPATLALLATPLTLALYGVAADGTVLRLTAQRPKP